MLLATLLFLATPQETSLPADVWASASRGDDASGDGSRAAPLRTLTRALAAAGERGARRVRLDVGTYAEGEAFPLALAPGLEISGVGQGGTVIEGAGLLLALEPGRADAPARLAGLTLRGRGNAADVGLVLAPGPALPCAARLSGVGLERLGTGARVQSGVSDVRLEATGLRASGCDVGVEAEGTGALVLRLADSAFQDCRVGVLLQAAHEVEPGAYDGPPTHHDVAVARTTFASCRQSGFERRGGVGSNDGPPYAILDCTFLGNEVGLELARPSADVPLRLTGTRFLANAGFGLRATGERADVEATSLVLDCEFRWNGVGLHVTNAHVRYEVRRSRFLDQVGNAIFLANFQSAPLVARVESTLVAGNGGTGVYTIADGERLAVEVLHCTIVANGGAGVERKTRHSGESTLEIKGCIVADNGRDLARVEPEEVASSLVGDGSAGLERGNLAGAPGFADAAARDFRLAAGSPCIDRGAPDPRLAPLDAAGRPRDAAPDLGALEHEP